VAPVPVPTIRTNSRDSAPANKPMEVKLKVKVKRKDGHKEGEAPAVAKKSKTEGKQEGAGGGKGEHGDASKPLKGGDGGPAKSSAPEGNSLAGLIGYGSDDDEDDD
jgi:hypothetical protein